MSVVLFTPSPDNFSQVLVTLLCYPRIKLQQANPQYSTLSTLGGLTIRDLWISWARCNVLFINWWFTRWPQDRDPCLAVAWCSLHGSREEGYRAAESETEWIQRDLDRRRWNIVARCRCCDHLNECLLPNSQGSHTDYGFDHCLNEMWPTRLTRLKLPIESHVVCFSKSANHILLLLLLLLLLLF